jgi:23S rRNA (guanine1835-N2)-methyltransferase
VGIQAKRLNSESKIIFCDESKMAIVSASKNYENYFSETPSALWTNCYENQEKESLDLVLCNPPFHQQSVVGDFVANQMFRDAHHALKKGGILRVVGNTPLFYGGKLKKIFNNSRMIAQNKKFTVNESIKK